MFRMDWNNLRNQPRVSRVYTHFRGRPAWVWGLAFLVGMLPLLIVIALLFLVALLITSVIYLVLSAVHEVVSRITGSASRSASPIDNDSPFDDSFRGRENVRVISPNHTE
jgi:hypothetical protein